MFIYISILTSTPSVSGTSESKTEFRDSAKVSINVKNLAENL